MKNFIKPLSYFIFLVLSIIVFVVFENPITVKNDLKIDVKVISNSVKVSFNKEIDLTYRLMLGDDLIKEGSLIGDFIFFDELSYDQSYVLYIVTTNTNIVSFKTDSIKPLTTLRFGGDVMMTSFFANYIDRYGVDYMWNDVSHLFNEATYSFVNLETSVSTLGVSNKPEGYGFRSNPSTLTGLVNAGIDYVNIANNHIFDYGVDAFFDTLNNLDEYNIKYTGAGANIDDAFLIKYDLVNDLKISFVSATSVLGSAKWEATKDKLGLATLKEYNYDLLLNKVAEAKENSDVVVVNLHWGFEYENYPEEYQKTLARRLIDAGATIIVGHHSHVLQGIEYYKNGMIFYSVGNFNFLISTENTQQTAVFEVNLNKEGIQSSKMYPVKIASCKANLLSVGGVEYNKIINNINERSNSFGTVIDEFGNIKVGNYE